MDAVGDQATHRDVRRLHNPWFVLGLSPKASRLEIERTGQKLIGLLTLRGVSEVYTTPHGSASRDPDLVRWAVSELRDPVKRLQHELWVELASDDREAAGRPALSLFAALGWDRR